MGPLPSSQPPVGGACLSAAPSRLQATRCILAGALSGCGPLLPSTFCSCRVAACGPGVYGWPAALATTAAATPAWPPVCCCSWSNTRRLSAKYCSQGGKVVTWRATRLNGKAWEPNHALTGMHSSLGACARRILSAC